MSYRADLDSGSAMAGSVCPASAGSSRKGAFRLSLVGVLVAGSLNIIGAAVPAWADVPLANTANETATALSQVTVQIDGFRNDQGDALLALFRVASDFPTEPERAERRELTRIVNGKARIVLNGLKPGVFALSVLHDEDGDRKVRTGLFGIPREGIGFSRNARGMFGPPKFEDARLTLSPGVNLTVSIRMHYY